MTAPAYNERIQWSPNSHSRPLAGIDFGAIHTQQGDGTAASLANYLCNAASKVSYHYTVDNDRNVVAVVDTDKASWSVGSANDRVVNICFAGSFAEWTRQQWLDRMGNGIEIAAWLLLEDARKYGYDPIVRGWDDLKKHGNGLTDHRGINMAVIGKPGHWDVGDNFPWDVLIGHLDRFKGTYKTPPAVLPSKGAIETTRDANAWLGDRKHDALELSTADGKGRFAEYQFGWIYWSQSTGAFAIPVGPIWDVFAGSGFESGSLGYPVGPKLDLLAYPRSSGAIVAGGVVQAFQHGTVYGREGDTTAYVVKGSIRNRFAKLGYEGSDLGWPQSNELDWAEGKYQVFEHGPISWIREKNATVAVVKGVPVSAGVDPDKTPDPVGHVESDDERTLTPKDGMTGGISYFAGPDDASTRGRFMGITGEPADNPWDQWFCAMRFGYVGLVPNPANPAWIKPADNIGLSSAEKLRLKQALPNLRLEVEHVASGRRVVLRPADWGPGVPKRVIDVSKYAMYDVLGADTDDQVRVRWVDPKTPLGPVK